MEWYNLADGYCAFLLLNRIFFSRVMLETAKHFIDCFLCRNMTPAAAQCYKATLSVTTGLSAPFNNLAIIYKQQVAASAFQASCL